MKSLIEKATTLPSIPKVVQDLIAGFNDPHSDGTTIANILSSDQVLTAKVLRLANSVKYAGHRKVGSVKDAVVILGEDTLRTLVLSIGLTSSFQAPESFNLKAFWRRSFKVANRTKWLAKCINADTEIAYTCGLLHAIGEYLIHLAKPEEAVLIDTAVEKGENRAQIEQKILGFDFTAAGAALADYWHFPSDIVTAIRKQLDPAAGHDVSDYAALIVFAQYMIDNEEKIKQSTFDDFPAKLAHTLHIKLENIFLRMETMPDLDAGIEQFLE